MGPFSIVDEGPSRVLCTLEEEYGSHSEDEVLSVDGVDGSELQLVCKEFGVGVSLNKSKDSGDEPSPICFLPLASLRVGLQSDWVLQNVEEICNCVGISCEGFED